MYGRRTKTQKMNIFDIKNISKNKTNCAWHSHPTNDMYIYTFTNRVPSPTIILFARKTKAHELQIDEKGFYFL